MDITFDFLSLILIMLWNLFDSTLVFLFNFYLKAYFIIKTYL